MNVLIVEDDAHKYSRISAVVARVLPVPSVTHCDNVSGAIENIGIHSPNRIILDMSLPSHPTVAGEGSPLPMPNGGIEVILELRILQKSHIPIFVLTQYEDIEVEFEHYSIAESADVIKRLYGIADISVVYFDDDSEDWERKLEEFLE